MVKLRFLLSVLGLLIITVLNSTAAEMEPGFVITQPGEIEWEENSQSVQRKIILGDPAEEGFYVYRARFPAGVTSEPHFHTMDRSVTVIEGTWYAGTDASHDMSKTTAVSAGGHMFHPAGAVHYDGSRGEAAVVEIKGMGPVDTVYVDVMP
tara:strand:+ start:1556 stop:2008 length:453 start_codon:yes stop_codon:yes gene_type:complete